MFHDPIFSPWGNIQTSRTLCPGVFEVSTAGHGGIMAAKWAAPKIFSEAAQKCGFWERGYLCFEEDCDAQVALRELMDRGLFTAPVNQHFGPGEYSACIDEITVFLKSMSLNIWAWAKNLMRETMLTHLSPALINNKLSVSMADGITLHRVRRY